MFGDVPNSALEAWNVRGGVSRVFERGFAGFSYTRNDSRYGVPVSEEDEPIDIDLVQNRYDAAGALDAELGPFERATLRFTRSDYEHSELEGEEPGTLFKNDENELRVELLQAARGELDGVVVTRTHGHCDGHRPDLVRPHGIRLHFHIDEDDCAFAFGYGGQPSLKDSPPASASPWLACQP